MITKLAKVIEKFLNKERKKAENEGIDKIKNFISRYSGTKEVEPGLHVSTRSTRVGKSINFEKLTKELKGKFTVEEIGPGVYSTSRINTLIKEGTMLDETDPFMEIESGMVTPNFTFPMRGDSFDDVADAVESPLASASCSGFNASNCGIGGRLLSLGPPKKPNGDTTKKSLTYEFHMKDGSEDIFYDIIEVKEEDFFIKLISKEGNAYINKSEIKFFHDIEEDADELP